MSVFKTIGGLIIGNGSKSSGGSALQSIGSINTMGSSVQAAINGGINYAYGESSKKKDRKHQKQMQLYQMIHNSRMQGRQFDHNTQIQGNQFDHNKFMASNSAQMRMKDMEKAGINKMVAYNGGSAQGGTMINPAKQGKPANEHNSGSALGKVKSINVAFK